MSDRRPILITGAAGFIGFHVARALLEQGEKIVGLDNLNAYYDPELKVARLDQLKAYPRFQFRFADIADRKTMAELFAAVRPSRVIHLAAQAGVRHSLVDPHAYIDSNVVGFLNVLEGCRHHAVEHLVYASSSSVYGANRMLPYSVADRVDHPVSLYAATKKSNELMAHCYSHLFGIPTTGLRFFTVYGPWGRPDMAVFAFTKAILAGEPIRLFNKGQMRRDFTYIDDIVEGVVRVTRAKPATYRLYNIGNNTPIDLSIFVATLEAALGVEARIELAPMQPGDVPVTCADVSDLMRDVGFAPSTPLDVGLAKFVAWYRDYYRIPARQAA